MLALPRILLVDDNESGLAARKAVLEELGYSITTAVSPGEALGYFAAGSFALVVTDFKLPDMNGVELIAAVRRIEPGLLVVLISGFAEVMGMTEASTGANAVIQKSSTEVTQLVRTVNRLLKRKPAKRQIRPPKSRSATA